MKTVLITGTSRGIGKALAHTFLEKGYFVIGTSREEKALHEHPNFLLLQLDLFDPKSIERCVSDIERSGKKLEILVNNAAVGSNEQDDSVMHPDALRRTLEVNVIGTADFTEQILPFIEEGGHIVNVSSRGGSLGNLHNTNHAEYRISKAALNMITRLLAVRLAGKITVSSIHPGWVRTDMGGNDADLLPEDAAESLFTFATSHVESGQFWYNGEKIPW